MNKKTKHINKFNHKSKKNKSHKKRTRRHVHKKYRHHKLLPKTKVIVLFQIPEKKHTQKIILNENQYQSGNMIKGLREM